MVRKGIPIPNDGQKVVALTVFREKRALFAIIVFDKSKVANIETLQKGVKSSHCNMDNTPRMAITTVTEDGVQQARVAVYTCAGLERVGTSACACGHCGCSNPCVLEHDAGPMRREPCVSVESVVIPMTVGKKRVCRSNPGGWSDDVWKMS